MLLKEDPLENLDQNNIKQRAKEIQNLYHQALEKLNNKNLVITEYIISRLIFIRSLHII